ncbi:MAG: alpha/beta hydrolase [Gemmatimonadaceae bacterium]
MSTQKHVLPDFVEVNGTQLAYQIAGSGHPVVLIHAGVADSRMWDDQFDAFARQFRVVRYDMRGFGQSAMARGTYSDRDDLLALLESLGIARAAIVGVSKGAMVALDFALDHPERVDVLVLASPALGGVPDSAATQEFEAAVDALDAAGNRAGAVDLELSRWVDGPHRSAAVVDGAVRERVREMDTDNFEAGEGGIEVPLMPPGVERLGDVHAPTLVIVGDHDAPETLENAERLVTGMSDTRKEVIHGTAHMLSMERPVEFNRIVSDFLNAH